MESKKHTNRTLKLKKKVIVLIITYEYLSTKYNHLKNSTKNKGNSFCIYMKWSLAWKLYFSENKMHTSMRYIGQI